MLGIAQSIAQFLIGPALPFSLDLFLPGSLSLEGFNQLIPLSYGASVYKSNGVFLAEPSFFSQFLAVGVIIEVVRRCRPSRLGLYLVALLCSYSGSGLIMLAVFVPFYLVQRRQFTLLAMGGLCIVVIVLAADSLQLDALVSRAREFSNPGSSGYARFISPFVYIRDHLFADPVTLLLGRGPGTVTEHFESYYYTPFDPTWAKLIYEFGVLGCAAYPGVLRDRDAGGGPSLWQARSRSPTSSSEATCRIPSSCRCWSSPCAGRPSNRGPRWWPAFRARRTGRV